MKENITKVVTVLVFAVAGLLGFNNLTNPEEISIWSGVVSSLSGAIGYYVANILYKATP